jgi:hypothetical protein
VIGVRIEDQLRVRDGGRLTVDIGILRRRAAAEKLFASTTFAKTTSELRSIVAFPRLENSFPALLSNG